MAESAQKGRKAQPARQSGFGVVLWIALVIVAAAAAAAGAWLGYERGLEAGIAASPPLIAAEEGPTKVAPEDEGGMEVPNRDALVFDAIDEGAEEPADEVLAAAPEEPVAIPALEEAAAAEGESVAGEGGEMAEVDPAPGGADEIIAVEEEVLAAPEPDVVEEAMAVAEAPEPSEPPAEPLAPEPSTPPEPLIPEPLIPEPLRIEPESAAETIVLNEPPTADAEPEIELTAITESVEPVPAAAEMGLGPRVQLAAFRSPERAEIGWGRIVEAHQELLGALEHWVVRVDLGAEKGIFHRLQAGPMADADMAKALCEKLHARDQGCLVVAP